MVTYILYNRLAGNGSCEAQVKQLQEKLRDRQTELRTVNDISSYSEFFASLSPDDEVIICGGDGTLNRFVNDIKGIDITNPVLYYAAGSGNDFLHDLGKEKGEPPFRINEYIQDLPEVTVNGKTSRFINAIGFGIDGYCCEAGDEVRRKHPGKPVNYTPIAIKGLLYAFKPCDATVIVDGVEKRYKKVWIAPAMHGRFYGGGMMAAPGQDRCNADGTLTVVIWSGSGKLKTLMAFPKIFEGKHVGVKPIEFIKCHDVTVRFDKPCALQIDGETILAVTEYSARSAAAVKADSKKEVNV